MPSVFTIRLVNNQPHEKQWLWALHISPRFRLQIWGLTQRGYELGQQGQSFIFG